MNKNIRRFAATVSLSLFLAATPVFAAPTRDEGRVYRERERTSIVQVMQRLVKRFFKVTPTESITPPFPAPSTPSTDNP